MQILHLTDRLGERGGAQQHLLAVIRAQVAAGHEVRLLAGVAEPGTAAACPVALVPGLESRIRVEVALDDSSARVWTTPSPPGDGLALPLVLAGTGPLRESAIAALRGA